MPRLAWLCFVPLWLSLVSSLPQGVIDGLAASPLVSLNNGAFQFSYTVDSSNIYIKLVWAGDNYVSLGFNTKLMADCDLVTISRGASGLVTYDGSLPINTDHMHPVKDAIQDWTIVSETVIGSDSRTAVIQRKLTSDDPTDYKFANGDIPVIWAIGANVLNGEQGYHEVGWGTIKKINFFATNFTVQLSPELETFEFVYGTYAMSYSFLKSNMSMTLKWKNNFTYICIGFGNNTYQDSIIAYRAANSLFIKSISDVNNPQPGGTAPWAVVSDNTTSSLNYVVLSRYLTMANGVPVSTFTAYWSAGKMDGNTPLPPTEKGKESVTKPAIIPIPPPAPALPQDVADRLASAGQYSLSFGQFQFGYTTDSTYLYIKLAWVGDAFVSLGFNATTMSDGPDTVIVYRGVLDGDDVGLVPWDGRQLRSPEHLRPHRDAIQDWQIASQTIGAATRTAVIQRKIVSDDPADYNFINGNIPVIWCVGVNMVDGVSKYHYSYGTIPQVNFFNTNVLPSLGTAVEFTHGLYGMDFETNTTHLTLTISWKNYTYICIGFATSPGAASDSIIIRRAANKSILINSVANISNPTPGASAPWTLISDKSTSTLNTIVLSRLLTLNTLGSVGVTSSVITLWSAGTFSIEGPLPPSKKGEVQVPYARPIPSTMKSVKFASGFTMNFASDNTSVYLNFDWSGDDYVAVGFNFDKKMPNSDTMYVYSDGQGVLRVKDGWIPNAKIAPNVLERQDWYLLASGQNGNKRFATAVRALTTGDPADTNLGNFAVQVIWARGKNDVTGNIPEHSTYGSVQINFVTGEVAEGTVHIAHYIVPGLYLIITALATYILRRKGKGHALFHKYIFGVGLGSILWILGWLLTLGLFMALDTLNNERQGKDLTFLRLIGGAAQYCFCFIYLPVEAHSPLLLLFGTSLERSVAYHRALGILLWVLVSVHGIGMLIKKTSTAVLWTIPTVGKVNGLGGLIAWIALTLLAGFALPPIRRKAFRVFYSTHMVLNMVSSVFAILHTPGLVFGMIFEFLLLIYNFGHKIHQLMSPGDLIDVSVAESSVITLKIRSRRIKKWTPGQYLLIGLSADVSQHHPFTISNYNEEYIKLHIKDMGPGTFTNRLPSILRAGHNIKVQGPFGSLSVKLHDYDEIVLIAGGIGVTPMAAILNALCDEEFRKSCAAKLVSFVWVAKISSEFEICSSLIERALGESAFTFELHLYETQPTKTVQLVPEGTELGKREWRGQIQSGRPKFESILSRAPGSNTPIALCVCGPEGMVSSVKAAARSVGESRFHIHTETFAL